MKKMKKAEGLGGIIFSFEPEPLREEDMPEFYCENNMVARTGDENISPIKDIFESCTRGTGAKAYLLLGHRGCGKSTELRRLKIRLEEAGHPTEIISASLEADLQNINYWDLLVLHGKALLTIAEKHDVEFAAEDHEKILGFWNRIEIEEIKETQESATAAAGVGAGTPGLLRMMLDAFAKFTAEIKYAGSKRESIRGFVQRSSYEWIQFMTRISDTITLTCDGKQPVLILEDLDRLDPEPAYQLFGNYASTLSQMPYSAIYTFPIALSYDVRYPAIENYFDCNHLPMIEVRHPDGSLSEEGVCVLKDIVRKRSEPALIPDEPLELLILKTGGVLRDLFRCITEAASLAERREKDAISRDEVEPMLLQLRSDLTRRFDWGDYDFLRKIYDHDPEENIDKAKLFEMVKAMVVLEYNGRRWQALHPLVEEFLQEKRPGDFPPR
jgi:hypothetical protein